MKPESKINRTVSSEQSVLYNLFRDTIWQMVGVLLSSGIMLATNIMVVRLIGREEFGAFGLIQTAAIWGSTFLTFGAPTHLMIQSGRMRNQRKGHLIVSAFIYLMIVLLGTFAWQYFDPPGNGSMTLPDLSPSSRWLLIILTTIFAHSIFRESLLRGADQYRLLNFLNILHNLLMATGVCLGAYLFRDYSSALWGGVFSTGLLAVIITVLGFIYWGFSIPDLKQILGFGDWISIRSYTVRISEMVAETFGILYLSHLGNLSGVAAVVGCQRMSTLLSKPAGLMHAILMGKVAGQMSGVKEAEKTLQVARLTLLFALFLSIPILLFPHQFTRLTLGMEFSDSVQIMILFILSSIFRSHAISAAGLLVGQGCPRSYVLVKILVLFMTVIGVVVTASHWGAYGVAVVQCLMSIAMTVGIAAILAYQAKSIKTVFVGDDRTRIVRLLTQRMNRQDTKGSNS